MNVDEAVDACQDTTYYYQPNGIGFCQKKTVNTTACAYDLDQRFSKCYRYISKATRGSDGDPHWSEKNGGIWNRVQILAAKGLLKVSIKKMSGIFCCRQYSLRKQCRSLSINKDLYSS